MKRSRHPSSSDDSDNGSSSTCWSQHSSQPRRGTGQKPSEVFRTDLITAMKVHDSYQLNPEDYYVLADPWRQDWEKGVQVPVSPQSIPQPVARILAEKGKEIMFNKPKKLIRTSGTEALGYVDIRTLAEGMCRYDLNEEDVAWLHIVNQEFAGMAMPPLDEITMERVMEEFERCCHDNMTHATETEEGLGIEYDEDVVCDVCQSPDGEDNNEMVFCDKCNICVHQACYGIQKVPKGSWLCRICALGILPKCQLCPKKGGAMKPTRSGTKWVHVSCALWIPEVSIGNPEKMEPITNVSHIPSNRWALICCLCKEKTGACIQCSAKNCRTAFHVTCGLHASLEMNTILTEDDEVKFKSYCPKHSGLEGAECRERDSGGEEEKEKECVRNKKGRRRGRVRVEEDAASSSSSSPYVAPQLAERANRDPETLISRQQEKRVNLRKLKLQEMEEDFYQFVEVGEVAGRLKLPPEVVDFLYQYWKLKRKANFNQPLLTPKGDEEESLARREQEVLLRRLQLFTHLRQDLERVRNLTYMVTRREKMKRSLWRVQEQIFQHQARLLDHELLSGDPPAKDLEKLFSLAWLSSQGSQSGSSWSNSGLKTKRGPSKQEKRKSSDRRSLSDSPHAHRKDNLGRTLETKDGKSSQFKEAEAASDAKIPNSDISQEMPFTKLHKPEVAEETTAIKPHKPESRKGPRREAPGSEQEGLARRKRDNDHEQEERRRKKRSEVTESVPNQAKNRFGSKHLDKTVSIRLVDIRNSDSDDYFIDEGMTKRIPVSLGVTTSAKLHRAGVVSDAAASTKANGWLRKAQANGSHTPNGPEVGHLKSWGKFRIPKRSEKPPSATAKEQEEAEQRKPLLRPLTNAAEPSYPRTRLRTGTGSDDYEPKADGELEPCLKRCHSHQLRGDSSLGRRYGSDIIRRGVLAS
ncbi:protein Jade-1 [Embiotoca jacksoni]|uniref:protein Jade-1 n=1 Tax=Embiotoca jacksoni TaxID=100190 RepID=UPI003703777E